MIGLGTQDDFPFASRFVADLDVATPVMLWDPSFATWGVFGVRYNSQMMVLSPDLSGGTELIYGFDVTQQDAILEVGASLIPGEASQ